MNTQASLKTKTKVRQEKQLHFEVADYFNEVAVSYYDRLYNGPPEPQPSFPASNFLYHGAWNV